MSSGMVILSAGADGGDGSNGADETNGVSVDLPVEPTAVVGIEGLLAVRRARRRARLRARRSMVGRRNSNATISSAGSCGSVPSS